MGLVNHSICREKKFHSYENDGQQNLPFLHKKDNIHSHSHTPTIWMLFFRSFVRDLKIACSSVQNWKPSNLFEKYKIVIYDDSCWALFPFLLPRYSLVDLQARPQSQTHTLTERIVRPFNFDFNSFEWARKREKQRHCCWCCCCYFWCILFCAVRIHHRTTYVPYANQL